MKTLTIALTMLATFPSYGQGIFDSLSDYQESLVETSEGKSPKSAGPVPEVKATSQTSSSSTAKCEENDQSSLTLRALTSLILRKGGTLDIAHDPRAGSLKISAPEMISNCSSMLDWTLGRPEVQGNKAYAIKVKFKSGNPCTKDGCVYRVAKVENGHPKFEEMVFKPDLKGFESCLEKSGVIVGGKVVSKAIYKLPLRESFNKIDETGRLLYVSPPTAKAKYGNFDPIDRCDYYEPFHPNISSLQTYEDAERERLQAEAEKLKQCKVNEYHKVADFLDKYEDDFFGLVEVRDRLILEATKKSAEAIASGKYTDEDLKVLADFDKYVVGPKVDLAVALHDEMLELEGDSKKLKQEELKKVLNELSALNQKPYFLAAHTQRLIKDGRFEEAEQLNTMKLILDTHRKLGIKQGNVVMTPEIARTSVQSGINTFKEHIATEKDKYEVRTGQVTGQAEYNAELAAHIRADIDARNKSYSAEIQSEVVRGQTYCYEYRVVITKGTVRCQQDVAERIVELQGYLKHYNEIDAKRAAEFEAKAKEYAELEAQGRRHIAALNGETLTEEEAKVEDVSTIAAPARTEEKPGVYTFDFQGGNQQQAQTAQQQALLQQQAMIQQQAQLTPNMHHYPTNPYVNNNAFMATTNPFIQTQQNPWLGQMSLNSLLGIRTSIGAQAGYQIPSSYNGMNSNAYSFNFAGGNVQQPQYAQPQITPGYWPYTPSNSWSMYGR